MKALSVKQPFAEFIATGEKDIELRTWRTDYRGPILICSSSKGEITLKRGAPQEDREALEREFPNGKAICVVELADIVRYPSKKEDLKLARREKKEQHGDRQHGAAEDKAVLIQFSEF